MLIFKAISSLKKRISSNEIPTVEYLLDEESHYFFFLETFSLYFLVINSSGSFRLKLGLSVSIKWRVPLFPFAVDIFVIAGILYCRVFLSVLDNHLQKLLIIIPQD